MEYTAIYKSPIGNILLTADETALTGAWFEGQRYFPEVLGITQTASSHVLGETSRWLDIYFSGKNPDFEIPVHFTGSEFQKEVWEHLRSIPYGKTASYGEIANCIAKSRGIARMSARAVGAAAAHNRISVIVPCHRLLGANAEITGYAGGIDKKRALLDLEGAYYRK